MHIQSGLIDQKPSPAAFNPAGKTGYFRNGFTSINTADIH